MVTPTPVLNVKTAVKVSPPYGLAESQASVTRAPEYPIGIGRIVHRSGERDDDDVARRLDGERPGGSAKADKGQPREGQQKDKMKSPHDVKLPTLAPRR